MAAEQINSILVADLGSVHTRLALFDLVEGEYRLIASARARTTAEPPLGKVSLGVERAAQRMSELIGRQLLDESSEDLFLMPESEGHGVDAFLAMGSAGRPMRVFLVGLTPEISLASGQRVLAGSFVTITGTLCPDDLRSETEQLNALLTSDSDLILIVGGTDGGADDILLAQLHKVARALSLIRRGTMPVVLYAGNQALRAHVKALLTPYTTVFIARNVRPTLNQEQLFPAQIELALVYDEYRTRCPGGFAEVGRYSQVGVVPTVQGTISAVRYLSTLPGAGRGPLCLDIGSANSVLVSATRGEPHYVVRTDLGIGHSFPSALEAVTPAQLRRWLPAQVSDEALLDYAYNKQLRPATIPATLDDLLIEQALAREIGRTLVDAARPIWKTNLGQLLPPFNPIIGAGAILAEAPHPGVSAMLLLDALQPVGMVDLRLDPHQALAALGGGGLPQAGGDRAGPGDGRAGRPGDGVLSAGAGARRSPGHARGDQAARRIRAASHCARGRILAGPCCAGDAGRSDGVAGAGVVVARAATAQASAGDRGGRTHLRCARSPADHAPRARPRPRADRLAESGHGGPTARSSPAGAARSIARRHARPDRAGKRAAGNCR